MWGMMFRGSTNGRTISQRGSKKSMKKMSKVKILVILVPVSVNLMTSAVIRGEEHKMEDKIHSEPVTTNLAKSLKDYPANFRLSELEKKMIRNPFNEPNETISGYGNAPKIEIAGFANAMGIASVFLNINNTKDTLYKVGDKIGSGFTISGIDMNNKTITISNSKDEYSYKLAGKLQ